MSDDPLLDALEAALDHDPRNGALWLHYAEMLEKAGRGELAIQALRTAAELPDSRGPATLRLVHCLRAGGQASEALIRAENALEKAEDLELRWLLGVLLRERGESEAAEEQFRQVDEAKPGLRAKLEAQTPQAEIDSGPETVPAAQAQDSLAAAPVQAEESVKDWADQFDWGDLRVTLDDVIGLDDVKRQVQLRIIAPFKQPEIYEAFDRKAGGGLLLYGPPGCGKTHVARATAGELGARFVAVSIHDIVDKYWGESEKAIHALFEEARKSERAVLFFDEFDALGSKRGSSSQFWRTLVDQLLQELDGIGSRNRGVLVMAATNEPWSIDPAFRRPGRFDRVLFVPPPDEGGRVDMLRQYARSLPGFDRLDLESIAKATPLFTGADIKSLCERAAEGALELSLDSGQVHEVSPDDFKKALGKAQSTALEWVATARNYARYANEAGNYDELTAWLKAIRKWT